MEVIWNWFAKVFTEPSSAVLQLVILYGGAFVAIIGGLIRGALAVCKHIWTPRPKPTWSAQFTTTPQNSDVSDRFDSDPNNVWQNRGRWTNGKNMEAGDWYNLFFDKPRMLSEITAWSEGERFPQKIRFWIKETRSDQWKVEAEETITVNHGNENTIFRHHFKKHQKVAAIKFEIIEPTLEPAKDGKSPAWAIYGIDFKEYMFCGCLLEHSIK
ncbi:MAG: hypothetical protein NTV42_07025 [Chloroflexi bacterium]|nr:hypothetical protein [Chloroflexota bacterium]